jgi:GT2 family glycosyltransferase
MKAHSVRFSIIIPTHNRFEMCLDAIESATKAAPFDSELILVNDGMPFPNYFLEKASSYVNIIHTSGGLGAGAARNLGAKAAKGEWLFFLDDDDIVVAEYWKNVDRNILNNCPSNSYGYSSIKSCTARAEMRSLAVKPGEFQFVDISQGPVLSRMGGLGAGFWIQKDLFFKVNGIDSSLKVNEDTDFCLKLVRVGARCFFAKNTGVLVYVGPRGGGDAISTTKSYAPSERLRFFRAVIKNNYDVLRTDRQASYWLWKRCIKQAAKVPSFAPLGEFLRTDEASLKMKIFMVLYFYLAYLVYKIK